MENLSRIWIIGHLISSFVLLMMLAVVVSLLRSRRPPANTLAWILAVVLIPYFGIPLYFIFGFRKVRGPGHSRRSNEDAPIRGNSQIEILTLGDQAYAELIAQVERATVSIDLATFIFSRDEVGQLVLAKLCQRARQGVRVRLLVDAWGSSLLVRPPFEPLLAAGGQVAVFKPLTQVKSLGQINLRNHRKLALFDEQVAIFGGMNIASEYLGPEPDPMRWVDLCVQLRGQSVQALSELFANDWKNSRMWGSAKSKAHAPAAVTMTNGNEHRAQIVASGPNIANDLLYDQLLSSCFEARKRIWIATPYFVPDETLCKALELASLRGVDVRLLTPLHSNHFFADVCRGSYIRQLREAGVKIYFYPRMSHAKLVLIDEHRALVGSANFDLRSLLYNYELGVFLYSLTEITKLETWLRSRFSEATLSVAPKPNLMRETLEGIVRVFGPLF